LDPRERREVSGIEQSKEDKMKDGAELINEMMSKVYGLTPQRAGRGAASERHLLDVMLKMKKDQTLAIASLGDLRIFKLIEVRKHKSGNEIAGNKGTVIYDELVGGKNERKEG
jgi:hypothetical protein